MFIDEEQLSLVEESMKEKGYFDGAKMAEAFNLLRANDLIWSFVVNNYLMGRDPFPFDLLYWNSDSTRMPRAMHSAYLRDMYQHNRLREPGGITLDGVPIDLTAVDVPIYILSTREDHIAPWRSTYAATRLYRGPIRFVLAMSGHIAGVVNPPSANKYGYFTGELAATPDAWIEAAAARDGSWWPDWDAWVGEHDGGEALPREPGAGLPADHRGCPGALREGPNRVDGGRDRSALHDARRRLYDPRPRSPHASGVPVLSDDIPTLRRVLAENRVIAMVGPLRELVPAELLRREVPPRSRLPRHSGQSRYEEVLGQRCYPALKDIPNPLTSSTASAPPTTFRRSRATRSTWAPGFCGCSSASSTRKPRRPPATPVWK